MLLPIGALIALHGPHLDDGFVADDATAIDCSFHPVGDLLFERSAALCYSDVHFTPLVPISFKIDRFFLGLEPGGAALHNLFAGLVLVALGSRLVAARAPVPAAALLASVWAVSAPFTLVLGWTVTRQWIWGLVFALCALVAFVRAEEHDDVRWSAIACVCFLLAILWKDAYLSVPLVAFLVASGGFLLRARRVLPLVAATAVYFAWRTWILGGLGGYSEVEISVRSMAAGVARSPFVLSEVFFSAGWLWLGLVLPLALGGRSAWSLAGAWIAVALPLSVVFPHAPPDDFAMRYLFPLSFVLLSIVAECLGRLPARGAVACAVLLGAVGVIVSLPRSIAILERLEAAGEEGSRLVEFLRQTPCAKVYVTGLRSTPQWYASGFERIHRRLARPIAHATLVNEMGLSASAAFADDDRATDDCGVFRYVDGRFDAAGADAAVEAKRALKARRGKAPELRSIRRARGLALEWSRIPEAADYLLYYGEESDLYTSALTVNGTEYERPNLAPGEYFFRVAARFADGGLGNLSPEVRLVITSE